MGEQKIMVTAILEFLAGIVISIINAMGYYGIVLAMAIESACITLPSEIIMPFSGYLITDGRFEIFWVVFAGTLGNLIGSVITYWIGVIGGRVFVLKYGKYLLMSRHDLDISEQWFSKYGELTILFTRNMPVIRTFISLPAGIAKMNFFKFCLYTTVGSIPWNFALTYLGMKFGANWRTTLSPIFHKFDIVIGVFIIVGIYLFIKRHIKKDAI